MATQARHGGGMYRQPGTGPTQPERRNGVFRNVNEERLATGLGWFSIGLGLAEVAAPKRLARLIGVEERTALIRGFGLREIASGVGILSQRRPAGFLWSRVAGDAMDLSMLGANLTSDNPNRGRTIAATAAVAGVTMLDVMCSQRLTTNSETGYRGIRVHRSVTINRSPEELYAFWRNFSNLPRFMEHLESVQVLDDKRSHWKTAAPAGTAVEWDAEIVEDVPNSIISWRSIGGADVDNAGWVRFERAAGGRGAVVRVQIQYVPPGGAFGAIVAKLFGEAPEQQLEDNLRTFKQIMETGEITKSDASIHRGMHPGQPPAERQQTRPSAMIAGSPKERS